MNFTKHWPGWSSRAINLTSWCLMALRRIWLKMCAFLSQLRAYIICMYTRIHYLRTNQFLVYNDIYYDMIDNILITNRPSDWEPTNLWFVVLCQRIMTETPMCCSRKTSLHPMVVHRSAGSRSNVVWTHRPENKNTISSISIYNIYIYL